MVLLQASGQYVAIVAGVVYLVVVPLLLYGIGKNTQQIVHILERMESSDAHELSRDE